MKGRSGDASSQSLFLELSDLRFSGNKSREEEEVSDNCGNEGKTTKSCRVVGVNKT